LNTSKAGLENYLKANRDNLSEKELVKMIREVCQGMQSLQGENVVHRDLAARNLLVTKDGHVKISDFGLSRDVSRCIFLGIHEKNDDSSNKDKAG